MPRRRKTYTTFMSGLSWMKGEPLVMTKTYGKLYYPPKRSSRLLSEMNIRRNK